MNEPTLYPYWTFAADAFGRTLFNKMDCYVVTPTNIKQGDMNAYRPTQGWGVECWHLRLTVSMVWEEDNGRRHDRHPEVMMSKFRLCFDEAWHLAARMEAMTTNIQGFMDVYGDAEAENMPATRMCVHTWIEGEEINFGVFRVYPDRYYAELAQKEEDGSSDFMLDIAQLQHITD